MFNRFIIALSFITTIPVKYKGDWNEKDFSGSVIYFPLIAIFIGLIVAVPMYFISMYNNMMSGVIGIILWIIVTGGIHLDGYMDSCDGLLSRQDREKALVIMKDSRVGSFAVIGFVLLVITKLFLYSWVVDNVIGSIIVIVMGFVFSRLMQIYAIITYPSARKEGLGVMVQKYATKWYIIPGLFCAFVILVIFLIKYQSVVLLGVILAPFVLAGFIVRYYIDRISNFLGGLTGDIYGAITEISEVIYLLFVFLCSYIAWIFIG